MKYRLVLTNEASDDYQDILLYTLERWGQKQEQIYDDLLDNALTSIRENPKIGRRLPKLPSRYRAYHVGRHYIIYREEGEDIVVFRILHDQMDLARHL
jgi:toxin ParE1/3/4